MFHKLFEIDHEFSWDQMYGGFLPPDANPFRKARTEGGAASAESVKRDVNVKPGTVPGASKEDPSSIRPAIKMSARKG